MAAIFFFFEGDGGGGKGVQERLVDGSHSPWQQWGDWGGGEWRSEEARWIYVKEKGSEREDTERKKEREKREKGKETDR